MRRHHPQFERRAGLAHRLAHASQLFARWLRRVSLDQRRVEARQVAPQRVQVGGGVDRNGAIDAALALHLLDDLAHPQLVLGIAIRAEQTDHDALDSRVEQRLGGGACVLLTQRQHLLPEHVDPTAHPEDPLARHERRVVVVRRDVQAIGVGEPEPRLDPSLEAQVVLVAGGHDQPDAPPAARQKAVEHRGTRVDARDHLREAVLGRQLPLRERIPRRRHEAERFVCGSGLGFPDDELAVLVDHERVGHRAAGIDHQHAWLALTSHMPPRALACAPSLAPPRLRRGRLPRGPRAA